jgi:hypothetical protein
MTYHLDPKVLSLDNQDKGLLKRLHWVQKLKRNSSIRALWNIIKPVKQATCNADILRDVGNIVVIFRHVFISADSSRFPPKSRPQGFSHEKCFQNLIDTISVSGYANRARVIVFYNGTVEQFQNDAFSTRVANCGMQVEIRLIDASSAVEAVLILMKQALKLGVQANDILYLLENDYVHQSGWLDEVYRLYESNLQFDYVSLYDHPDRYRLIKRYANASLFATSSRHWVSAASTCGTFMMRYDVFLRDFSFLYSTKNDHQMFRTLTGRRGRRLLTPVPGLSLHSMCEYLDPVQDLQKYFLKELA